MLNGKTVPPKSYRTPTPNAFSLARSKSVTIMERYPGHVPQGDEIDASAPVKCAAAPTDSPRHLTRMPAPTFHVAKSPTRASPTLCWSVYCTPNCKVRSSLIGCVYSLLAKKVLNVSRP